MIKRLIEPESDTLGVDRFRFDNKVGQFRSKVDRPEGSKPRKIDLNKADKLTRKQ